MLPPVIFFNLAAAEIDLDHGVGLGSASSRCARRAARLVGRSRVLQLPRPRSGRSSAWSSLNTYLGYPLMVALLGRDQLSDAVLYDVLVSGPACCSARSRSAPPSGPRRANARQRVRLLHPQPAPLRRDRRPARARALAPDVLVDISQVLVVAILPIGFFAVGATLAEGADHGSCRCRRR